MSECLSLKVSATLKDDKLCYPSFITKKKGKFRYMSDEFRLTKKTTKVNETVSDLPRENAHDDEDET